MRISILIAITCIFGLSFESSSQEINCNVTVLHPQVGNVDVEIFRRLEATIQEFINDRKWTDDTFEFEERIDCNIQLTISEVINQRNFKGQMQIQSVRPVYNSDYKTPVFAANDNDIEFIYWENTLIQFSMDQHRDNLSSLLAYYAYMVIAADYDTFSLEGGTDNYLKAQTIVANAQRAAQPGWKASEGRKNRYWLVENILSQTFRPMRKCAYEYHRLGFDIMHDKPDEARAIILNSLRGMRNVQKIRPSSYNLQMFFFAKHDELVKIYSAAPEEERLQAQTLLNQVDPGHIQNYQKLSK